MIPIDYRSIKNKELVTLTRESIKFLLNEKQFERFSLSVKSKKTRIQNSTLKNESFLNIKNKIKFYENVNKYKAENILKFVSNKKQELFYCNGVLKTEYTPEVLLKQNLNVVFINFIAHNENGFKFHVKIKDLDYYLYFVNKNIKCFWKNILSASVIENWGEESNKYNLLLVNTI